MQGLEKFRGRLCLVVFVEDGRECIQKGEVTGIDENFIYLESLANFFAINLKDIVKIKAALPGRP